MIEVISINRLKLIEWKLTINEGALMSVFSKIEKYSPDQINFNSETYHILTRQIILNELPSLESTSAIKHGITGLENKGILKSIKVPSIDYTYTAYKLTKKGQNWNEHIEGYLS